MELHAIFANEEDSDDIRELVVFSVSREVVKTQSLSVQLLESEVDRNLTGIRISDDEKETLMQNVTQILEDNDVRLGYE